MIPQDILLAIVVLVLLFGTIIGLVSWARGAAPHDDGLGAMYGDRLPGPADDPEGEGWQAPRSRLPTPLPGDEERLRARGGRRGSDEGVEAGLDADGR